jgi:hypothetical protein
MVTILIYTVAALIALRAMSTPSKNVRRNLF